MVPRSLRLWFVVHFYADVLAAVPLFLAPRAVQGWLGWTAVDPLATRLVAAALFGIGIESYLARNAGLETFRSMLNLKVIWSSSAVIGVAWSQFQGGPVAGWGVLGIFVVFNVAWVRFRLQLPQSSRDLSDSAR